MSAHLPNLRAALVATSCALALTACSVLFPKDEPMEILAPQVHVAPDPAWPQVKWQLAIGRPNSNDLLESNRLAVVPSAGRIQVYKGVSWEDTVPNIIQSAAVEAFEDSGRILSVGRQASGLHNDFVLQFDLRNDEAVYQSPAGPPEVLIVMNVKLVDANHGRAISSRTFRATATSSSTEVHAVARAFDSALSTLMHDVVGWTLVNGQQAHVADEAEKKRGGG